MSAHFSDWREETPRLEGCKSAVSWTPESPHENMSCTLQRVRRGRNTESSLPRRWHHAVKLVQYTLRRLHERIGRDEHINWKTKASSSLWPSSPLGASLNWWGGGADPCLLVVGHFYAIVFIWGHCVTSWERNCSSGTSPSPLYRR